ncbi:hypothetical protein E3Q13_01984 [Wallemia mellicola]|uniref:Uncharacterized protein n=1 Tax=Wallemia mellicola TaxID=1708541 RepID=A0AB38MZC2_9BASI|nr:hypothetical protein E3Q13_01984 [Wallemia mellicola]TIC66632.1 hypothetical protein E3Q02_01744 [Wallemia mellicola]
MSAIRRAIVPGLRSYSNKASSSQAKNTPQDQTKGDKVPEKKKSIKEIDDEMISKLKDRDTGQEEIEEGNIEGGLKHHVRAQKFRLI